MNITVIKQLRTIKIAYIGGGSRGWAWTLMQDLAQAEGIQGEIALYDINYEAALDNEFLGNQIPVRHLEFGGWHYKAECEIGAALTGADFVIISILPGTFKEMRADVHLPEKYGIYQPVGDTTGPGGIIRSLRTIPMFEIIAKEIRQYCPNAWVINYTNPMAVCTRTLYEAFPEIKAFGCCHEVFGTQKILCKALEEIAGIKDVDRHEIRANVVGLNHFTWLTDATYQNMDLIPIYSEYIKKHNTLEDSQGGDGNWMNKAFVSHELVKFDLFERYGIIAAAGDRHLAEFCPPAWYTKDPQAIHDWGFTLTTVDWREQDLLDRLALSSAFKKAEKDFPWKKDSGEEGVRQMQAILGMGDMITNVNLPNVGQISNLPKGLVVETNAAFATDSVRPVLAGDIPSEIYGLVAAGAAAQDLVMKAGRKRDLSIAFEAFLADLHVQHLSLADAKMLFDEMIEQTKIYLGEYIS